MAAVRWSLVAVAAVAAGCKGVDVPTFKGGGADGTFEITQGFDTDTAGDSGTTVVDEDAPVIEDVSVAFEDYPGVGDVIEMQITWSDAQDDMEGGRVFYNVTGDQYDNEPFTLDVVLDSDVSGAANEAYIDSDTGKIILALAGVDTTQTYTFTEILIQDALNNDSATVEATLEP